MAKHNGLTAVAAPAPEPEPEDPNADVDHGMGEYHMQFPEPKVMGHATAEEVAILRSRTKELQWLDEQLTHFRMLRGIVEAERGSLATQITLRFGMTLRDTGVIDDETGLVRHTGVRRFVPAPTPVEEPAATEVAMDQDQPEEHLPLN